MDAPRRTVIDAVANALDEAAADDLRTVPKPNVEARRESSR